MTPARPSRWTILRDRAPFRAPTDADVLGSIIATDRQQAQRAAERLHGPAVVVLSARAWPVDDGRDP